MDWPRWMRAQQSLGHLRLQPRRSRYFRLWTARPLRGSADLGPVRKSAGHARAGETQDVLAQMALPPLQGLGVRGSSSGSGLARAFCCGLGLLWRLRLGGSGTLYVSGDEETAAVAGRAGRCVCVEEAVLDIAGGLLLTLYGSSNYRAGMRGALGAVLLTLYGRSTNRVTACDTSITSVTSRNECYNTPIVVL